jgi:hypothetical protein
MGVGSGVRSGNIEKCARIISYRKNMVKIVELSTVTNNDTIVITFMLGTDYR